MSRLIDADALMRDIEQYHLSDGMFQHWVEVQPTIEPERKKGEWLTSDDMYETGICSCCRYDTQEPVSYVITNFEHCPNCGADMRGERNE